MNAFGIYPSFTWIEIFPQWGEKRYKMWFIWLHFLQGLFYYCVLDYFGFHWVIIIIIYLWKQPSHITKDWQNPFKRIKHIWKHCKIHEEFLLTYLEILTALEIDKLNFSCFFFKISKSFPKWIHLDHCFRGFINSYVSSWEATNP